MKTIQLQKSSINIASSWEDLTFKEKIFTFGILGELFSSTITPETARLKMLVEYTGYRPSVIQLVREAITKSGEREIINFNLLKLSEALTFAFKVEENSIIPNSRFLTNPISHIRIGRNRYPGKRFELDITAKTNITAREFSDCFDLLSAQRQLSSDSDREECVNQICAILFPGMRDYRENRISGHDRQMRVVHPAIKFGVIFWFTGIVKYYTEHPVYRLLFGRTKKEDSEDKISLGMNEITLSLQKEGFGNPDEMTINDYFDAQIRYLKDTLQKAVSDGVKIADISKKTGLSLATINKLT